MPESWTGKYFAPVRGLAGWARYHVSRRRDLTIHIIRVRAGRAQAEEMLEEHGDFIKLAVDVERQILAGGGAYHSDCEVAS